MAITKQEFFNQLQSGIKWNAAVAFLRTNPLPIDALSVFSSIADLESYTSGPLSYPGQVVAVVTSDSNISLYVINGSTASSPYTEILLTGDYEVTSNKVTSISPSSTDTQYPSAKLLYDQLLLKLDKKPDNVHDLISNNKINLSYLPDVVLGQLVYGGVFNASTAVATLTTNAQAKLSTSDASITLTNDNTDVTGYVANEGLFYVVQTSGTFAGITFVVGDWLLSTGNKWDKIDNTDEVTSVNGDTGAVTIDMTVNGTSVMSGTTANIETQSAYNELTNKIATVSDLPTNQSASQGGTTDSLVTTGDKYNWNNKSVVSVGTTGTASDNIEYITINGTEHKIAQSRWSVVSTPVNQE